MNLVWLQASLRDWQMRLPGRKLRLVRAQRAVDRARVNDVHPRQHLVDHLELRQEQYKEAVDRIALRKRQIKAKRAELTITTEGGARGVVEQAVEIAMRVGGPSVFVGSDHRPGERLPSGQLSDHAGNDRRRAARDIGVRGVDLLKGPPQPELDAAIAAIGKAFGRDYGTGRRTVIDTFPWRGYRIQIIHRTPKHGGHMGHGHLGVHEL